MLTYLTKIILLLLVTVSSTAPLLSDETCAAQYPKPVDMQTAEPLNLNTEEETALPVEASPIYILTII
ncbi:MAG TPA: hypothetical protein VIK80_04210 [Flavihumibacter sp.]|jgi:hypothetical protein